MWINNYFGRKGDGFIKVKLLLIVMVVCSSAKGQSLLNVEGEKSLYLGGNLLDNCECTFDETIWSYEGGKIKRNKNTDLSPFIFHVETKPQSDYYFHVTQEDGTLTDAFHVKIGEGKAADPYNLTKEMSLLLRSDGGLLYLLPKSGESFCLKELRLSEIVDSITNDSVCLEQNSVAIGVKQSSIGGKWNVAIGDITTMANNLNATRSIAIGHNTLTYLESGIQNIGIGTFALHELKYGERNIGLGPDAMYRTMNAYDNVAIGRGTMANESFSRQDITLERNVAIGNYAMHLNTESTQDAVAIGYRANMKSGSRSVALGNLAGREGGDNNVSIGFNAGVLNKLSDNVVIGYRALRGENAQGDGNVVIGSQADLVSDNSIVSNGVAIGRGAKTRTNSIAIGYGTINTKDNQTTIGNVSTAETVIYGDLVVIGSDGAERRLIFNKDGSISWKIMDATSTRSIQIRETNYHEIYDLRGYSVKQITSPGIYIIDGVKMYVDPQKK